MVKLKHKLKIAVVGCGRISINHFESILHHSKDLEPVAVCDNDKKKVLAFSEKYKVPGFSSISNMLNAIKLDIVSLCTPSGFDPDQAMISAKKKVHVITEKPMSTNWHKALKMESLLVKETLIKL